VNAEFMPFQQHERGIHAKNPGTGGASVTEVPLLLQRHTLRPQAKWHWA
jgi:hypothetical protein